MYRVFVSLILLALTACGAVPAVQVPTATIAAPTATITLTEGPTSAAPTAPPDALPTPAVSGLDADTVSQMAVEMLARQLQIDAATLQVVDVSSIDWPTSALGCPSPDRPAMQVIVPGYRIQLSDGNQLYSVHTSAAGLPMIWCDRGGPVQLDTVIP